MVEKALLGANVARDRLLVVGVGNLLMGDEGVGVHALRALRDARWPDGVALVDGASGTFHLLARLQDFRRLIVIEGVEDGAPAGTVAFVPLDPEHLPRMLERHDVGLRDLVESAALLGPLPEIAVTASICASLARSFITTTM